MIAAAKSQSSLGEAALAYVRAGWRVLALRAGSKVPATGHGLLDATTDEATVRGWWSRWPQANVGLALPADCFVIDVDSAAALAALAALDLPLPATSSQRTPRGRHLVYRLPPGVEARQTVGELAPGVDTRAGGRGYIVVAPSVVAGRAYDWLVPLDRDRIAPAPDALLALLGSRPVAASAPHAGASRVLPFTGERRGELSVDVAEVLAHGVEEGRRNWQMYRALCALRREGADAGVLARYAALANKNFRPPLPGGEIATIVRSAMRHEPAEGAEGVAK
jgi:hypothetical protein